MKFLGEVGRDGNDGHKHAGCLPKACFRTVLGWPHIIVQAEQWHRHPWFSISICLLSKLLLKGLAGTDPLAQVTPLF